MKATKLRYRLFIRNSELSSESSSVGHYSTLLAALRAARRYYSSLGKLSIRKGIFYDSHYKQIILERELAAYGTIGLLIVDSGGA